MKDISMKLRSHGVPGRAIALKNVMQPNLTVVDTLHKIAVQQNTKQTSCTNNKCLGSLMMDTSGYQHKSPRSKDVILDHAADFIHQFYASTKSLDTAEYTKRLKAVKSSIKKSGTYKLTYEELEFGARTAWRNVPRCIGRIQWSKLQVFDCTQVKTARDMFDCILTHLKYSTNGGNLRSAISVFPPRQFGTALFDFKVWNSLLISYAGYRQADGSIIGDPINVEVTEVAIKLGWKAPGGRFDVLPLILQAAGDDPEVFDIPPEYVLEVALKHPEYPSFEELGLKWFAVPGVSNVLFDCGGLEFTGAPFTGWYMSTEVATRDLCDSARYNVLEEAADKFGLATGSNPTLWKDKVCLELNIAVLDSFNKSGVTIVDHHSASESFMKHLANEQKLRGGCPADWVWIVPPMGGSLTQVFHQEMLYYKLKPNYEYQERGWVVHNWKKENNIAVFGVKKVRTIKIVAIATLFISVLTRRILAKRTKCTILYATETGRSEMYATKLEEVFKYAFNVRRLCMDEYEIKDLNNEQVFLVVASTTGNGDAPTNGNEFQKVLRKLVLATKGGPLKPEIFNETSQHPLCCCKRNKTQVASIQLPEYSSIPNVQYSVFGLGSKAYPNFCQFAHDINRLLVNLGAIQIQPVGEGCEIEGQDEPFQDWAKAVFEEACMRHKVDKSAITDGKAALGSTDKSWKTDKFHFVNAFDDDPSLIEGLTYIHKKKVKSCTLKARKYLKPESSQNQAILATLAHNESDHFKCEPGDHVAIYPANDSNTVQSIMNRLVDCPAEDKTFTINMKQEKVNGKHEWIHLKRLPVTTVRQALTHYLDITTPPSQRLLSQLIQLTQDTQEQESIQLLAKNPEEYLKWKKQKWPNIAEVLELFPSLKVPTMFLLTQLPILQQRYYSISSSPKKTPGQLDITAALVQFKTQGEKGTMHKGVCSNYLNEVAIGEPIPCFIRLCPAFHLPKNSETPIIMVATGTGIAPFRSFWQDRCEEMGRNVESKPRRMSIKRLSSGFHTEKAKVFGPMELYFGCRTSSEDNIHGAETINAYRSHVLTSIYNAVSRDPDKPKTYVQQCLDDNQEEVYNLLDQRGGHLYVCGAVTMAQDVRNTLVHIIQEKGKMTEQQAQEYFARLKSEHRYHEDIFGIGLGSGE